MPSSSLKGGWAKAWLEDTANTRQSPVQITAYAARGLQHWKHFLRGTGQASEVETGVEEASEWISAPCAQLPPLLLETRMTC